MEAQTFHWVDYVVFVLMLVISTAIGVYYGCFQKKKTTADDLLVGGRDLHWMPAAMSMKASFLSAISILGIPAEVYYNGPMYGLMLLGYLIGYPTVAHIFVPILHPLKLVSGYEYLERRYNRVVRSLTSATFILFTILYMAVALYAPAIAFSTVTGMSLWVSLLGMGAVCTFYTALGGLKAIVWTDTFQMIVVLGGLIAIIIQGCIDIGGLGKAWNIATDHGRTNFANFSLALSERGTLWTQWIGGGFLTMSILGSNQTQMQRYLSIGTKRDSQKSIYFTLANGFLYLALLVLLGVVMFSYYVGCDPYTLKRIDKTNQIVPLFMMDVLGHMHGLPGLFTAAVFGGALSTLAAGLNALSAILLEDIIRPVYLWKTNERLGGQVAANLSKVSAVILGCLTVFMAYGTQYVGGMIIQLALSIFGIAGGPLLGIMLMGMLVPFTNEWGAGAGLLVSLFASFWLGIGAIVHPPSKNPLPLYGDASCLAPSLNGTDLFDNSTNAWFASTNITLATTTVKDEALLQGFYNMSYMWYTAFSAMTTIIVGSLVSLCTGRNKGRDVDPNLIFSLSLRYCPGTVKNEKDPYDNEKVEAVVIGRDEDDMEQEPLNTDTESKM